MKNDGFWDLGGYRKLRPALKLSPYMEQVARYCEVCMWDEVLFPIFDLLSKLNFFKTLCCNSGQGDHVLNSFLSQEAGRLIQKTWVGATGPFGSLTRLCSQDCPLTEQLKKREGTFTCYDKYEYEILSRELMNSFLSLLLRLQSFRDTNSLLFLAINCYMR